MPFFIIFVIIPLTEIMVFIAVGERIGLLTTLALAFSTAIIGGALVRHQGLQTFLAFKSALERGRMPLGEIFDGFCLIAAGALLITPGFVTDTLGFLLLFPPVRAFLRHLIKTRTSWHVETETTAYRPASPDIIEGEYERLDEDR